ncbi:MAG: hypothetical protein R3267_09235 [Paenisporosarcina sp.]|nr:hypothetical protein [Paenisporosarcina sp.]
MKKWIAAFVAIGLIGFYMVLSTKFHYPELPFSNKTKYEVAHLANTSTLPLSKITQEDGYIWFVTDDSKDIAEESLKKRLKKLGWEFIKQEESGYFFEKNGEKVRIESKEWTNHYLLFQLPIGL